MKPSAPVKGKSDVSPRFAFDNPTNLECIAQSEREANRASNAPAKKTSDHPADRTIKEPTVILCFRPNWTIVRDESCIRATPNPERVSGESVRKKVSLYARGRRYSIEV